MQNVTRPFAPKRHLWYWWRGWRAVIGVVVAVVGVLAATNPESSWFQALSYAMPQLADAVPTLITACGALIAAFSEPPQLGR